MKSIKLFGIAALAALATMALFGVSSAMAESTQLCKLDVTGLVGELCPAGEEITTVHEVSVGEGVLLSSAGPVECLVLFEGTTLGLGAPLVIHGHFKYGTDVTSTHSCELIGTKCTVKELSKDALIEVLKLGHETADVASFLVVEWNCGKIFTCTYKFNGVKGTAKGPLLSGETPDNGNISVEEQTVEHVEGEGLFCPATAKLDLLTVPLEVIYYAK
jgi:hypothetical protein